MITFLRKIRQKLLSQNRITRYLGYAIGEIFLVVIGILIALQVNNWNESRKERNNEIQLLMNLQEEFKDNLQDLDSVALEVEEVIYSLERLFLTFSSSPSQSAIDSVDIWISQALRSPNWKPSEYQLNSLTSSGNIAGLKNERLKILLYQWSRQQKEMLEVQIRTEVTGEEIISYIKEFGTLRNVDTSRPDFQFGPSNLPISNRALLSDARFESMVDDKLFMYKINQRWLKTARGKLVDIIQESNP